MSPRSWRDRVRDGLRGLDPYHVPVDPVEVKLDANESPYPPPPGLLDEIAEAVRHAPLHRYPDPSASRLRALVADDLGQPPERLVFGNGSDELIALLCQTFAEPPPGRERGAVVYPAPSFVVFRTAALAAGLEPREAALGPRFEPDAGAVDAAVRGSDANLVFIATPNNPTGTRWPRDALERLVADHPSTVVIVDEAYGAYSGETHLDLIDRYPHCAILRTYSKVGLAALRLGVLVAQPELAHELEKVRAPYNLGLLPQLAGELAIGRYRAPLAAGVAEVIAERERLARALARLPGVEVFPSAANLLLLRVARAFEVWTRLLQQSVRVRNLDRPGALRGCLRVTIGIPEENRRFLEALTSALQEG
jgi:histidinol-phosphate aminotransferase